MIRRVWVRGRYVPAPLPPGAEQYTLFARRIVSDIQAIYLESLGLNERTDALPAKVAPGSFRFADLIRNTDRTRSITEHGISILTDRFMEHLNLPTVVDALGRTVVGTANRGFDATLAAVGAGRKLKTQVAVVDARVAQDTRRFIESFRRENLALIRKLVAEQVAKTETVLQSTYGAPAKTIAAQIQSVTGTTTSHAELLARDQTLKLNSGVQEFRAKSLGSTRYTWITANDERVRGRPGGVWADAKSNHWRLHGLTFEYNQPPVTNESKGIRLNPGKDFQCRCVASPDLSHIFE